MKIAIINGPNLNLLGQRETSVYGTQSFEEFFEALIMFKVILKANWLMPSKIVDLIKMASF